MTAARYAITYRIEHPDGRAGEVTFTVDDPLPFGRFAAGVHMRRHALRRFRSADPRPRVRLQSWRQVRP